MRPDSTDYILTLHFLVSVRDQGGFCDGKMRKVAIFFLVVQAPLHRAPAQARHVSPMCKIRKKEMTKKEKKSSDRSGKFVP